MITNKEYKKAKEELKQIIKGQDRTNEKFREQIRKINDRYYKLKRKLEEEEREEKNKKEKDLEEINDKYGQMKENPSVILEEYKEIINFLKIDKKTKWNSLKEPKVYKFDYIYNEKGYIESKDKVRIYYKPFAELINDKFKKILTYITENDKPKNKFSLIVVGNSKFNEKILKIPYSYGINAHIDDANIRKNIKDFPTKEEAKSYFEKNKGKILKEFLEEHKEKEERFKEIIKETEKNKNNWDIAVLEDEKEYYENNYSHGEETDEYKAVIKELKRLENE